MPKEDRTVSDDLPVLALTGLGILIAVLGLFNGGFEVLLVGLGAIAVAGLLSALGRRRGS
jgi:hypothetical protein